MDGEGRKVVKESERTREWGERRDDTSDHARARALARMHAPCRREEGSPRCSTLCTLLVDVRDDSSTTYNAKHEREKSCFSHSFLLPLSRVNCESHARVVSQRKNHSLFTAENVSVASSRGR